MRGAKGIKRHNAVFHLFKNASKNAQVKIWPFLVIFGIFGPLPPLEKIEFWLPDHYAWKGWQPHQSFKKPPVGHFLGFKRDQCQRKSPKRME